MTRIRFKGFPRYDVAGVSARLTGAPLGTAANVGALRPLSTQCHISALRRPLARASDEVPIGFETADAERARDMADGLDVAGCGERRVMAEHLVRGDLNADGVPATAGADAMAAAAAAAVAEQGDEACATRRGIPADHVHHDDIRRRDRVDDAGVAE